MMLWNHTWTTGSIYPLHVPGGTQLPRYLSKGTESGGASAGLMDFHAFTHLEILAADCSRGANSDDAYGVFWLQNDGSAGGYGYFSGPAIYEDDGSLDWHELARAGRGDSVYLLRYYPERFLLPDGSVNVGTNLPFPSVKAETPIEDPAR